MRRLGHFRLVAAAALLPFALAAQGTLVREGGRWVETITGMAPATGMLRVNAEGPVRLEGRAAGQIVYTARLTVNAATEAEARRILAGYAIRAVRAGNWVVLVVPGDPVMASISVKAPRLDTALISTTNGSVDVENVDGNLQVESGAGELKCNRIRGNTRLTTGGGDIRVGEVDGSLRGSTGGGRITVKKVGGEAVLETALGDIEVTEAGSTVQAETAGGLVRVNNAAQSVSATTGGGPIVVGRAGGVVVARNMAGPVQVGAAAGVRCESGTGGIRVSNVSGPLRVSTAVGNIMASLLAGKPLADSFLTTGDGDITVLIPSNLGVTVWAENSLADSPRRIVSDFPGIPVRMRGMQVVAEGQVNGGGPLLRISGMGGTIYIKREP